MAREQHTPDDKDKMCDRIDGLRAGPPKRTRDEACAIVAKEMGKKASAVRSLYIWWSAAKKGKPWVSEAARKARGPSDKKVETITRAIQTAVNSQGAERANKGAPKIPPQKPAGASRTAMLHRILTMNERIMQELLDEEQTSHGVDHESES